MDNRKMPSPEQARAELERRARAKQELARREESAKTQNNDELGFITGSQRSLIDPLRDAAKGALVSLGNGGQSIASAVTGGYAPTVDMEQVFSGVGSPHPSVGGALAEGIGSYLPYGMAGGARLLPELGGEGLGAKLLSAIANPGQAAAGAAFGYANTEPGETNFFGLLPSGKGGGALKGALFNSLFAGGARTLEAMRPSKIFRGNLSDEELAKNLELTRDTKTGLGSVIDSPFLQRQQENVIPHIPFSGGYDTMQKNAVNITEKGNRLLEVIGGEINPETQNQDLLDALKEAHSEARAEKTKNYNEVNRIADQVNLKVGKNNNLDMVQNLEQDPRLVVGRETFAKTARKAIDEINESPELKREMGEGFISDLKAYATNEEGNTLKLSNIFKGKLNDKANELYSEGKTYEAGIVSNLKNSLGKDIDLSIENSGNPELKAAYDKAQQNYKEKFAPFDDPDIAKFIRKGGDPDLMLSHFLKTGVNDRSTILKKVMSKIQQSKSSLLPLQMYLSRAIEDGKLNPMKLRTLYHKLGENQRKVLIPDASLRKEIEDYTNLVGKNTESFKTMFNPATGQRTADSISALLMGLVGHAMAGNVGGVAGAAIPIVAGRMANRALTSPTLRENLVNAMIENKPKFTTPGKVKTGQTLAQALAGIL